MASLNVMMVSLAALGVAFSLGSAHDSASLLPGLESFSTRGLKHLPGPLENRRCGTSWEDANNHCNQGKCPNNKDIECPNGLKCWSSMGYAACASSAHTQAPSAVCDPSKYHQQSGHVLPIYNLKPAGSNPEGGLKSSSAAECWALCLKHAPKCKAATFNLKGAVNCWLKTVTPGGGRSEANALTITLTAACEVPTGNYANSCNPLFSLPAKPLPAAKPTGMILNMHTGKTFHLGYSKKAGNKFCDNNASHDLVQVRVTVKEFNGGKCEQCKSGTVCKIWAPDSDGNYGDDCSATLTGSTFLMTTSMPGDETSKGWGSDPFPHWHYSCCCGSKCQTNKFYYKSHNFDSIPKLGGPNQSNVAQRAGLLAYYDIILA